MTFRTVLAVAVMAALGGGCAGRTSSVETPAADETSSSQRSARPAPHLAPPPLTTGSLAPLGAGAPDQLGASAARTELRRSIFQAAWTTVRDRHYDPKLGGVDWEAMRRRYEPLALGAPDEPTFYRVLNQMLGELGQSHMEVTGPGAEVAAPGSAAERPGDLAGGSGDPGLLVRLIEGLPTIAWVRAGSGADRAGLRPGLVVTHIGGEPLGVPTGPSARPLRPVEERFRARLQASRLLAGPVGSRVTVRLADDGDAGVKQREVVLERERLPSKPVQFGLLPPLHPDVRVYQRGDVGVVAFNFFLLEQVLPAVQRAIDGFRARGAKALILDLRGNPGGVGAMAIPVAARLTDKPLTLGTIQFRDHANTLTASPSLGVQPFLGRVAILTDEGTASTSEMLAAGLQEARRAVVVGDTTLGAVLPSTIETLPGGAVIQVVVADFRTPKGVLIEGRGVQPDRRVIETRAALASGRDPVLEAALALVRGGAR